MDKYTATMLSVAHTFSQQSYATRLKVGAVLAKNGRILATGYNGTIEGTPNSCELDDGSTSPFVLHAEQNLIAYCARTGIPTEGTTLYLTHSPCPTCSKLIAAVGIRSVIYSNEYRDTSGLSFLTDCGTTTLKA